MAGPPPFFLIPSVEQRNDPNCFHIQSDIPKSNRGRKPSKAPPPRKKQRRRGMGVAQLEKIIKNMAPEHNQPIMANSFQHVQVGVPLMVNNNGGVLGGFEQGFENGTEFNRNHSLGPFWSNPYVLGAPSVLETSNELSSMPKLIPCDSCCKKKLVNGDECLGHYNGSDFQGLSLDNQFGAFFPNNNNLTARGPEVVTVHRKMEAKGRNFFMEYDFFPEKNKQDTYFKEMEKLGLGFQDSKASSCLTTSDNSAATATSSNSVDLSLKLSF